MTPHPFLNHPRPIAFAHRGGALEAEENTMAGFERAVALGYTHIETDVQATRDGVAVIFHDDTLDRMVGEGVRVDALDWADLARLRTKGGHPIARVDEVLEALPDTFLNLEPKSAGAVAPLAEAIARADALDRVCVGSFEPAHTARLREMLGPGLCWSPSYGGVFRLWLAGWGLPPGRLAFPVAQVPPEHRGIPLVTRRTLAVAHRRGLHVQVWTVDEAAEMERLIDLGVDGIMTDRPTLLREVLLRRGLWQGTA